MTLARRGVICILLGLSLLCLSVKIVTSFPLSLQPLHEGIPFAFYSRSPSSISYCNGSHRRQQQRLLFSGNDCNEDSDKKRAGEISGVESSQRRRLLQRMTGVAATASIVGLGPSVAKAGEVGARINAAITKSELGISVRTSVVKGAQMADKIDGQWEKLSDQFGLGSERNKQVGRRPKDKKIPDPLPLNIDAAQKILDVSDEVFLKLLPSISQQKLLSRIEKVAKSTLPSFERSGVVFSINNDGSGSSNNKYENVDPTDLLRFRTAPQFNFVVYTHFKAYSEFLIENGNIINFANFRSEYERGVGQRLIETLQLADTGSKGSPRSGEQTKAILKNQLLVALEQTDNWGRRFRELGLVASVDRNSIESTDDLQDFVDDALADLIITVSVDGDVTQQSQILLQEQGYRLYPNFNRFMVTEFFRDAVQTKSISSQSMPTGDSGNDDGSHKVSVMDYYFDTNYNTDPDKFEVKQVVLNISIE